MEEELMLRCNPEKSTDSETGRQDFYYEEDDDVYDLNEVGQREMNKEETEIYCRVVSASEGFDVPYFPHTMGIGRIEPIDLPKEHYVEELWMAATLSISDYNKKNACNYEVVEIIKANYQAVKGYIFFVTYSVKPANTAANFPITIFQAKVYWGFGPVEYEIMLCRPKPSEGENELAGDRVGMKRCC